MKAEDFMEKYEKNLKIQGEGKKEGKPEARPQEKSDHSSKSESDRDREQALAEPRRIRATTKRKQKGSNQQQDD